MYALARNDKTAGGVDPRPYAAFVVTGAVIVRADRVVRPYKMSKRPPYFSFGRLFSYDIKVLISLNWRYTLAKRT